MDLPFLIESAAKVVFVVVLLLSTVPILVWGERKVAAWIQDRTGPNRVGPVGLLQPVVDVVKLFFKESVVPQKAHRALFFLAPMIEVFTAIIATATIPFGDSLVIAGRTVNLVIADLDMGILWVFAISSFAVYGVLLAGWSSANHFSFMGGLRSSAQIISYELALTLSVVGVILISGSLRLREIVEVQGEYMWNFWLMPFGFIVFLVAMFAETNRTPFDLPEAEAELVAGYHTEYTSMGFAMFFMAEYIAMITMSALMVTLFFGGWHLPGLSLLKQLGTNVYGVASFLVFCGKTGFFLFLFLWVRWTLPRFRYDQLMTLGWKAILPLAFIQVMAASVLEVFGGVAYGAVMVAFVLLLLWFLRTPRTVPPAIGPAGAESRT